MRNPLLARVESLVQSKSLAVIEKKHRGRNLEVQLRDKIHQEIILHKGGMDDIISSSEFFQDLISYCLLGRKDNGFYVDIGAYDGIEGSNTYFFEQVGWKGICIEPEPRVYKRLLQNRKCMKRNIAVSSLSGKELDFFAFPNEGMECQLSGIVSTMNEWSRNRINQYSPEIIKVMTLSFTDLMHELFPSQKFIDFLSIDVECHEMEVLAGIDFMEFSFGLITIEKSFPSEIISLLNEKGYSFLMTLGADFLFVPQSTEILK